MKSLFQYIVESTFSGTISWIHKGDYRYAEAVLNDILSNKDLQMVDGVVKASDFDRDVITEIQAKLRELDPEKAIDMFQSAYNGPYKKKIWSNIEKTVYSGKVRKIGGGLEFEDILTRNIQSLILDPNAEITEYKEATLKLWNAIKDRKTIKNIIAQVSNGADVGEFVQVTGKGSTARNNVGQIINKETFEVNMSKQINLDRATENVVTNVLTQSGKIIADVTISDKPNPGDRKFDINHVDPNDIYISCKDGSAQFTGISMQQPFYGDAAKTSKKTTLIESYENHEDYKTFLKHNDICTKAFSSMCKMFDCNPEEVYNYFSNPVNKRDKNATLTVGKADVDNDIISTLMQLQIGGNYWYVNSNGDVIFLNDELEDNKFIFKSVGKGEMHPSMIRIKGILETKEGKIGCDLVFRTSGNFDYPYRLFFDIKDHNIIQKLYC